MSNTPCYDNFIFFIKSILWKIQDRFYYKKHFYLCDIWGTKVAKIPLAVQREIIMNGFSDKPSFWHCEVKIIGGNNETR